MAYILGEIVGLALAAIFLGTIFVVGMQQLATANTTGLTAVEITLMGVLGLIIVLAAVILVLRYVGVGL